ncbi:MAG: DUF2911 domain-containing protein [Bacteroidia bacterium]|nr:DUF2911 domain-containing protein [Bacteroidia bacterium]
MKALIASLLMVTLLTLNISAQEDKSKRKSPPAIAEGVINGVAVKIDYSQPEVKGRTTWGGELVPFEKIWRTGANEATWLETSGELIFNGGILPAGKYSVFTIPHEDNSCTVIFNSVWDQWGPYQYDKSKDVLRISATKQKSEENFERMTFVINGEGFKLMWHDWYFSVMADEG